MTTIEQKVDVIPQTCEEAIKRAMASQEKKLDQKFSQLLSALSKRSAPEPPAPESDEDMENTPVKAPPVKK